MGTLNARLYRVHNGHRYFLPIEFASIIVMAGVRAEKVTNGGIGLKKKSPGFRSP